MRAPIVCLLLAAAILTATDIGADAADQTLKLATKCPGFMFAVGNHIPSNVPVENAMFYFDYLKKHWAR